MGAFCPLDFHPTAYFIIWEKDEFSHQFPTVWENATKPFIWGEPGKLVIIIFPQYGCFFPLDSHPTIYFIIWKMHGLPYQFSIVQENATKSIIWGRAWEIGTHDFPIVWMLFSHQIPILWYTSPHGKYMCFLINFP